MGNSHKYKSMAEALHTIYRIYAKASSSLVSLTIFYFITCIVMYGRRTLKQSCFASFLYFFVINLNLFQFTRNAFHTILAVENICLCFSSGIFCLNFFFHNLDENALK